MKTISAPMMAHLASEVTTLAICWKVMALGGATLGFTGHTEDLTIAGILYRSAYGFSPTTIQTQSGLNVDNLDIKGFLAALGITEADVNNGVYDGANFEVFLVNWADLTMGTVKLRRGFLGNTKLTRNGFEAEVRGLLERFQRQILELYTPACRADLGDVRCGIVLATYTETGTLTAVTSKRVFRDSSRTEADGWFLGGLLTWTSGLNIGRTMEVKQWTLGTKEFQLVLPMRATVQVGDQYSAYAGCDKRLETCRDKFSNVVNFRGEPFVPQEQSAAISAIR